MTLAPSSREHEPADDVERPAEVGPERGRVARSSSLSPLRVMAAVVAFGLPMSEGLTPGVQRLWDTAVIATLAAMTLVRRTQPGRRGHHWVMATVLAAGSAAVTMPNSIDVGSHQRAAIALVVIWALGPPTIVWLLRSPWGRTCGLAFLAGQTFSAVVALYVSITRQPILGSHIGFGRTDGLAGHPNILGLMAAVVCVWTLDHMLAGRGTRATTLVGIVNFVALLLSGSLSALAALLCGAFVCAVARRLSLVTIVKVALAGVALLVASSQLAAAAGLTTPIDRVRQTSGQTDRISTVDERWRTWQFGLREIGSRPWSGVGLDDASGSTDVRGIVVHNSLIRAWFQGGPFLGIAALIIFSSATRLVIGAVRRRESHLASAALTVLGSFSLTSAALQQPYFWLLFICAWCALANQLPVIAQRRSAPTRRKSRSIWRYSPVAGSHR